MVAILEGCHFCLLDVKSLVNMKRKFSISSYEREIDEIRARGRKWGLSEKEISFAFDESLSYLRNKYPQLYVQNAKSSQFRYRNCINRQFVSITFLILLIICFGLCLNYNKPAHNFLERNIQEIIYPFMKLYRRLTLPLVKTYPTLSELYDESCLLENPYFQVSNMDCWPCENIKFILNLTESKQNSVPSGLPYIVKTNDNLVTISDIKKLYQENSDIFTKHSERIQMNGDSITLNQFFSNDWSNTLDFHALWRINRMEPGRVLRKLLGLPKKVANYEPSILIERYLLFDGPMASPYQMPATEGANVFLKLLSGSRLIVLEPTIECLHSCQRLSVLLSEQHTLWYNWWYWRPISLPVMNSTEASLAFIGSAV